MRNRIVTVLLVGSLIAGTALTILTGQPVTKAEAETADSATPTTWPVR